MSVSVSGCVTRVSSERRQYLSIWEKSLWQVYLIFLLETIQLLEYLDLFEWKYYRNILSSGFLHGEEISFCSQNFVRGSQPLSQCWKTVGTHPLIKWKSSKEINPPQPTTEALPVPRAARARPARHTGALSHQNPAKGGILARTCSGARCLARQAQSGNTNTKCMLTLCLNAANSCWGNIAPTPALAGTGGFRERASQLRLRKEGTGSWLVQNPARVCFLMELLLVAVFWVKPFKHAKHVAKTGIQKYWSAHFEVKLKVSFWKSWWPGTAALCPVSFLWKQLPWPVLVCIKNPKLGTEQACPLFFFQHLNCQTRSELEST